MPCLCCADTPGGRCLFQLPPPAKDKDKDKDKGAREAALAPAGAAEELLPALPKTAPAPDKAPATGSAVVFLGSGSSTGVPTPLCVVAPPEGGGACAVCTSAVQADARLCPNFRGNPSLLVLWDGHADGRRRHIQIDCGKTFRESVLRWFPHHGVRHIDALVLTHAHADAIFGLDDVRGIQSKKLDPATGEVLNGSVPLPVHLSEATMAEVAVRFDYLCPGFQEKQAVTRMVAAIEWHVLEGEWPSEPFDAAGLQITPLPVYHGSDYISLGFLFGAEEKVAYISDVSAVPPATLERLEAAAPIDLLIVDTLFRHRKHNTHFNLSEALDFVRLIRPKKALLTGLTHEFEHDSDNRELAKLLETEGIDVQLARDGLCVPMKL